MDGYAKYLLLNGASRFNVLLVTTVCDAACLFCSHAGNPHAVSTYDFGHVAFDDIIEAAGYLDSNRAIIIGESATRINEGEPFCHPEILSILAMVRERFPNTLIKITTNGSRLDEATIISLAGLRPIELNISLNSATLMYRQKLMGEFGAATAIAAPSLLRGNGIIYHGSVVCMPQITGMEDILATIRYLDANGARTIRAFVPGWTRFSPDYQKISAKQTAQLIARLDTLSDHIGAPLTIEPRRMTDRVARIEGIIAGSPAQADGLRRGDVIVEIDGRQPYSRVDAHRKLGKAKNIFISRNGSLQEIVPTSSNNYGAVVYFDIDPEQVKAVKARISNNTAVFVSSAAYLLWAEALSECATIVEVASQFFGGNICSAGLLTIEDFLCAKQKLSERFERIILPQAAFDERGRDLTGRHCSEVSADVVLL